MNHPILTLTSITRSYHTAQGEIAVLRDASLTLRAGELVALVGPSGSGKSTLLHLAGLLDSPQSGNVHILKTDASRADDATRTRLRNRHIGFIYQFHNLLPELSAEENVMLPQLIAGVKEAAARARARTARAVGAWRAGAAFAF